MVPSSQKNECVKITGILWAVTSLIRAEYCFVKNAVEMPTKSAVYFLLIYFSIWWSFITDELQCEWIPPRLNQAGHGLIRTQLPVEDLVLSLARSSLPSSATEFGVTSLSFPSHSSCHDNDFCRVEFSISNPYCTVDLKISPTVLRARIRSVAE